MVGWSRDQNIFNFSKWPKSPCMGHSDPKWAHLTPVSLKLPIYLGLSKICYVFKSDGAAALRAATFLLSVLKTIFMFIISFKNLDGMAGDCRLTRKSCWFWFIPRDKFFHYLSYGTQLAWARLWFLITMPLNLSGVRTMPHHNIIHINTYNSHHTMVWIMVKNTNYLSNWRLCNRCY